MKAVQKIDAKNGPVISEEKCNVLKGLTKGEGKKTFVDFILESQKDKKIIGDFLGAETAEELKNYFVKTGYDSITTSECEKLLKLKDHFEYRKDNRFSTRAGY